MDKIENNKTDKSPSRQKTKDPEYDVDWLKGTAAEQASKPIKKIQNSDYSDPVFKKLSKINGEINDMDLEELTKNLKNFNLDCWYTLKDLKEIICFKYLLHFNQLKAVKKEVLQKRLKSYYRDRNLKKVNITEGEKCHLDYVCVIDYEATCIESAQKEFPHEIIEFPVVLVNMKTLTIDDEFSSFCKPVINPKLTKFCTSLTGITQEQVDGADEFPRVLERVNEWLLSHELGTKYKFAVATDGPWDMNNFLNLQCLHNDLNFPYWARKWIDVRKLFSNWAGVRRCGILKMLGYFDLEFEGKQHCGLDDANNIARVLLCLAKDGCKIKCNDEIKKCLTKIEPRPKNSKDNNNSSTDENENNINSDGE